MPTSDGWSKTWTFYEGDWHEGNVPIMGVRSHAAWLGSMVFDGARAFEGVAPDLDLHCARVNASAKTMALKPIGSGRSVGRPGAGGMRRFEPDTTLYIRPMYWAERAGPQAMPPDPDSTRWCLTLYDAPHAQARRLLGHAVAVPAPDPRDRAGRRQGRLPLSEQRARPARGALARLRQLLRLRHAGQRRRARQLERLDGEGRRGLHADAERHVPQRHYAAAGHRAPARAGPHGDRDGAALSRFRKRRRDLRDRQCLEGPAGHPHRRALAAARAALSARRARSIGSSRTAGS